MKMINWKNSLILGTTFSMVLLATACSGDKGTGVSSVSVDPKVESETVIDPTFIKEDGTVDIAKMDAFYTHEAQENWGDDEGAGLRHTYVSINTSINHISITVDDEEPKYRVDLANCVWPDLYNDNSQIDAWLPGTKTEKSSDFECKSILLKSQKVGNVVILALRGFAGYSTILRAAIITKSYSVTGTESSNPANESMTALSVLNDPQNLYTVQATKIFMPPQIDVNPYRGIKITHPYFKTAAYNEFFLDNSDSLVFTNQRSTIRTELRTRILGRQIYGSVRALRLKSMDEKSIYENLATTTPSEFFVDLRVRMSKNDWHLTAKLMLKEAAAN